MAGWGCVRRHRLSLKGFLLFPGTSSLVLAQDSLTLSYKHSQGEIATALEQDLMCDILRSHARLLGPGDACRGSHNCPEKDSRHTCAASRYPLVRCFERAHSSLPAPTLQIFFRQSESDRGFLCCWQLSGCHSESI